LNNFPSARNCSRHANAAPKQKWKKDSNLIELRGTEDFTEVSLQLFMDGLTNKKVRRKEGTKEGRNENNHGLFFPRADAFFCFLFPAPLILGGIYFVANLPK
jgi:hypothetical protein